LNKKRFCIFAFWLLFCGAVLADTNDEVKIKDSDAAVVNAASIQKVDSDAETVEISKFARDYDALEYGAATGATETGAMLIAQNRCDSGCDFESLAVLNVEGASQLICKVEFSTTAAPNAAGYLAASDHNATAGWIIIGTWSSVNTDIPDDGGTAGLPALNDTATVTHGTAIFADIYGYEEIKINQTVDMGAGEWISIWCDGI